AHQAERTMVTDAQARPHHSDDREARALSEDSWDAELAIWLGGRGSSMVADMGRSGATPGPAFDAFGIAHHVATASFQSENGETEALGGDYLSTDSFSRRITK